MTMQDLVTYIKTDDVSDEEVKQAIEAMRNDDRMAEDRR